MTVEELKEYKSNKLQALKVEREEREAERKAFQKRIAPILQQFVETMKELGSKRDKHALNINRGHYYVADGKLFMGINSGELAEETPILGDGVHLPQALNNALKAQAMHCADL